MIEIITASEKEIPIIEDILLDTVRWLDSVGQSLWREEQVKWARLSKSFQASDFQIALLDGVPAACLGVVDHDPTFWPDIRKGASLYIQKVAVKRFAAGKGLSDALITHVRTMCMDRGIAALRLDCSADRPKQRAVYERNGFDCVGEKDFYFAGKKYPVAFYRCEVNDTKHLYHYFEKSLPPLQTITALSLDEATARLRVYQAQNPNLTHPNIEWFLKRRYEMEKIVRDKFFSIGGKPANAAPVYFTLGANEGMKTWFQDTAWIKIPVNAFDINTVSFTYGDMFPVFNQSLNTGEEWWEQVYRYDGIMELIDKYGYPDDPIYDSINGIMPKDKPINQHLKYIEAHVWDDTVLNKYRREG